MLLYITAEDVFGTSAPGRRGPRPQQVPETVAALYHLGLRYHARTACMLWPNGGSHEPVPDWKLDRLALRVALFARERLGVEPGRSIAIFGKLSWLWPVVDFAAMGSGNVAVGLEHDLGDDAVTATLALAEPGVVFATDAESAARLAGLGRARRLVVPTLVGEDPPEQEGHVTLGRLLDLAASLDTAERARSFRSSCRQVAPDAEALWHEGRDGRVRLTHREAMATIATRLETSPAREGDLAYLGAPRVSVSHRLAMAAGVGDGLTTVSLGREGRTSEDVRAQQPHTLLVDGSWLDAVCAGRGPRWPGAVDRRWARRRVRGALGDRLRWVEATSAPTRATARALKSARIEARRGGRNTHANEHASEERLQWR